jgi:hypothetical protein
MPVPPLLLGWLLLAAAPVASEAAGYLPSGSPVELYDVGRLALLRDPGVKTIGFGPSQKWPREEGGRSVLAEVDGPGVIRRLWFANAAEDRPGVSDRKDAHLRIILDGRPVPALDVTLDELFSGRHPHFPRPLVNEAAGGFVCYVPVAFRNGCKVEVDGTGVRHFQVDVVRLPSAAGVTTFTAAPTKAERDALTLARELWRDPDSLFTDKAELRAMAVRSPEKAEFHVDGGRRSMQRFILPAGPRTIRSLDVVADPRTADAWRSARIRLIWEGDDPAGAGVDVPLGFLFAQVEGVNPHQSLLAGQREQRWWNRFPMPYRRQALIQVDAEEPVKGLIRVRTVAGVDPGAGYFRAVYRAAPVNLSEAGFDWLQAQGRGHLVGLFLVTETPAQSHQRLAGSVRLAADGGPASYGQGLAGYFNGGWIAAQGPRDQAETSPVSGFPLFRRDGEGWRVAAYRWHATDPVSFSRSISAGVEPPDVNRSAAGLRAAAFWYSERPGPSGAGD